MAVAVERGAKAATVVVLDRIATALDTSLSRLLTRERTARVIILRRSEQTVARDPAGWERRIVSPVLPGVEFKAKLMGEEDKTPLDIADASFATV